MSAPEAGLPAGVPDIERGGPPEAVPAPAAQDAVLAREAVEPAVGLPGMTGVAAVIMGVSGSGKTALAERLSAALGLPYAEADEFHAPEAIAKMAGGTPLTDEDRWPWLRRMRDWMGEPAQATGSIVTCSALKRSYRDVLREAPVRVVFLHVAAEVEEVEERMLAREHFMPASLLPSQLATLEPLEADEDGAVLHNGSTLEDLTERALRVLADG